MTICGGVTMPILPDEWKGDDYTMCCIGASVYGAERCTCWEPIYAVEQQPITLVDRGSAAVRAKMCGDCAYRSNSPEMNDERRDDLLALPYGDNPFWCHQGIRKPLEWRHPDGRVLPGADGDYRPPEHDNAPYKADGTIADVCAGWAAAKLAQTRSANG